MPFYKDHKEYKWARYGGIESDETLDIIKYELVLKYPVVRVDGPNRVFKAVTLTPRDFYIVAPQKLYAVSWGDNSKTNMSLREYTIDFSHEYINTTQELIQTYTVIFKGHGLIGYPNTAVGYVSEVEKTFEDCVDGVCKIKIRRIEDENRQE